jgi:hypothetical protein
MSFLLFEGVIAAAVLLALAELVSWWAVGALPVAVAAMVKLNDLVTGALTRAAAAPPVRGSQVYRSQAAAGFADLQPPAGPTVNSGSDPSRVERRLDEAARRAGISGAGGASRAGSVSGSRSGSRSASRQARAPRAVDPAVEREVVARPEWRQTVTLGRHARRDDSGAAAMDADQSQHRSGPANQRRFA